MFIFSTVFRAALATAVIGNIILTFLHINLLDIEKGLLVAFLSLFS